MLEWRTEEQEERNLIAVLVLSLHAWVAIAIVAAIFHDVATFSLKTH